MDPVSLPPLPRPAPAPDAATTKAAEEFEAVFIASFLGEMLEQSRPKIAGGGSGEQMFGSLLANEIAREIARSGGIGLAESVAAQLDAYRR
jgi:peptidoglycan hydrolase FlgJ